MSVWVCGCVSVSVCVGEEWFTGGDTRGAWCGYRPPTPNACRSKHSTRACAARKCTWNRFACGSPGWLPCLDCPQGLFRTAPIAARSGAC